ncbi:hypothetical protein CLIB1423_09S04192 [[Candida] railenensis]|uniref:Peptidase M20 dimerisation domain-containing protein n=1 Tax=[Candida] railenensis TaxID=45579 RepID=A0A9P0QPN0_9ASCO|nr:hypothetical protein CLIB1423_09S04192 [[Candida] railenensis]
MQLYKLVTVSVLFGSVLAAIVPGHKQVNFDVEPSDFDVFGHSNELTDYEVSGHSLLTLHRDLVKTPSVSGSELAVAEFLARYLTKVGLTVELQKVSSEPLRYNVYAYIGKTRDTKLLITSHIDTVPPYIPYHVEGTKIYGRGTCDAKGSVASQVFSVLSLIEKEYLKEGDISLLYVVGEEKDGSGMRSASANLNATWESAIFGEPTELKLGVGHKGNYLFELFVEGKASHSGYPELGISATEILVPVLQDLLKLDLPKSDVLGPTTINIGRIEAGVAANVVPAHGYAQVFIRVAADLKKVDQLVKGVIEGVEHLTYDLQHTIEPQFLDYDVPGFDSIILAYATDVPNLTGQNLKLRYLYGPGSIHVAHGDNEFVENSDLLDAIEGYKNLIEHILGKEEELR